MHTSCGLYFGCGAVYKFCVAPANGYSSVENFRVDSYLIERMLFMKTGLLEEVSAKLNQIFQSLGYTINADDTYLNSTVINDQGEQVVDYSESLSWAIMEKVQADERPAFNEDYAGVFSERWTFDPVYRVVSLDVEQVNLFGRAVVESYRSR
jgi:hypothetical protein